MLTLRGNYSLRKANNNLYSLCSMTNERLQQIKEAIRGFRTELFEGKGAESPEYQEPFGCLIHALDWAEDEIDNVLFKRSNQAGYKVTGLT